MKTDSIEHTDNFPPGTDTKRHDTLQLWRAQWKDGGRLNVSYLIAAHSYGEACAVLKIWGAWPRRKSARVWAYAGPANDHNLKGWKSKVINSDMEAVKRTAD